MMMFFHLARKKYLNMQRRVFPKYTVFDLLIHLPAAGFSSALPVRDLLQRSLQYTTCSQSRAHFFRQAKGRWQTGQVFWGRSCFFGARITG
jgi:hypothetical protein